MDVRERVCAHAFVSHKCEFPMRTSGNGLKASLMLIKYRIQRELMPVQAGVCVRVLVPKCV